MNDAAARRPARGPRCGVCGAGAGTRTCTACRRLCCFRCVAASGPLGLTPLCRRCGAAGAVVAGMGLAAAVGWLVVRNL